MKNSFNLNEEELDLFANATIQYNVERQLRLKYDKILTANKYEIPKKESFLNWNSILKIAAIAIVILGSVFLIQESLYTPNTQSYAQTLLDQTNISGNPDITRKGANPANVLRREANDAFSLKNYPLAIKKYKELEARKEIVSLDLFYLGISQLKTNNYAEAIHLFSELSADDNFDTGELDWLLSLAYVLSNQDNKAVPVLEKIISKNKYKVKEARGLLEKLN